MVWRDRLVLQPERTDRPDVIILASHLPGETPPSSSRFAICRIECIDEWSYWAGVETWWDTPAELVNVERDHDYSDKLVTELLDCPYPLCSYPYLVQPEYLDHPVLCATVGHRASDEAWVQPGDEWADFSSIGFCKIGPAARVLPLFRIPWKWVEHEVDRNVAHSGLRWHLHWPDGQPIEHHHDYSGSARLASTG